MEVVEATEIEEIEEVRMDGGDGVDREGTKFTLGREGAVIGARSVIPPDGWLEECSNLLRRWKVEVTARSTQICGSR